MNFVYDQQNITNILTSYIVPSHKLPMIDIHSFIQTIHHITHISTMQIRMQMSLYMINKYTYILYSSKVTSCQWLISIHSFIQSITSHISVQCKWECKWTLYMINRYNKYTYSLYSSKVTRCQWLISIHSFNQSYNPFTHNTNQYNTNENTKWACIWSTDINK